MSVRVCLTCVLVEGRLESWCSVRRDGYTCNKHTYTCILHSYCWPAAHHESFSLKHSKHSVRSNSISISVSPSYQRQWWGPAPLWADLLWWSRGSCHCCISHWVHSVWRSRFLVCSSRYRCSDHPETETQEDTADAIGPGTFSILRIAFTRVC